MYYVLLILTPQGGYVGEVHGYNSMEACQSRLEIMKEVALNSTCELGGGMKEEFEVGIRVMHLVHGEGVVTNDKPRRGISGISVRFLSGHCGQHPGFYVASLECLTIIEHINLENV